MHLESFPNLTSTNFKISSPASWEYNCIAWSLGDSTTWWSSAPGYYWPPRVPKAMTSLVNVLMLYEREGFIQCDDDVFEAEFEKVALYVVGGRFVHVALQVAQGLWTSKLGPHEDIAHNSPDVLAGGEYGAIAQFMKRPRPKS